MVKLINFNAEAAIWSITADISTEKNIEATFKNNLSASFKSLKTITEVMAAGPANNGTASGLNDNRINSSFGILSAAALLFRACRLQLTISNEMRNKIARHAILNVSSDIFECVRIKNRRDQKI